MSTSSVLPKGWRWLEIGEVVRPGILLLIAAVLFIAGAIVGGLLAWAFQ